MDSDSSDSPAGDQAFAIEGSNDEIDLNVPPTSGNEYLLRVRKEASGCPRIVVAKLDTSVFHHNQSITVSEPGGLLPVPSIYKAPMAWQKLQVAEFAAIRQKLNQVQSLIKQNKCNIRAPNLPNAKNPDSWCKLCFGRATAKRDATDANSNSCKDSTESSGSEQGSPPYLKIVAFMTHYQVTKVLEYHVNWLEETGFTSAQGRWFYALLASLQKPLTPEMCSWLRRLARLCSNIRASLDSPDDPRLKELNLVICLVSRYFDQMDLADS